MSHRLTDHLIVISFDCLSGLDFPILKELPHFQDLLNGGAYCDKVETIYPSVTYPCHATIVTGNYPHRHGIINNTLIQPGRPSPDWYWHRDYINGTTLFDEAKKAGLTTAALMWPVTAKANIDYNMPEIFANRPWQNQIIVSLRNGSPRFQLEMNNQFGKIRKGLSQPELDDFVAESAVRTIITRKPNLLLVHFTDLDTKRHYHGFSSKQALDALKRNDKRLGKIVKALKESGIYDRSTIIALGDHSALDEAIAVKLNVLFHEIGLIRTNPRRKVIDWSAYCKSCDGSAYIYLKGANPKATEKKVHDLLQELLLNPANGIEKVITGKEAATKGADGNCTFMIEARRGFYFVDDLFGDFLTEVTEEDVNSKRSTYACHGYSPEKEDYTTILFAKGKGIRANTAIPAMHLVDEGPSFARLLGLNLGNTDGKVVEKLLELP